MPLELLEDWLSREIGPVNEALEAVLADIPDSCRPIAAHILHSGGKRLRPLLTVLCASIFSHEKTDIYKLASSMEMLHAATLLHDDIIDNATARRGTPSAHTIFGNTSVILAGDAMLACGNSLVASFGNPELCLCYSLATSQTAAGEILEMNSLHNPRLTYDAYIEIARGKTACLIAQSCRLGALAANAPLQLSEACANYGEKLGIAFQLVDDALDFAPQSQTGKPCGGDLREGKMTPPLMLYRQNLSPDECAAFDENFQHSSFSEAQLASIAAQVEPFAARVREMADSLLVEARAALVELPQTVGREVLVQMTAYVGSRSK